MNSSSTGATLYGALAIGFASTVKSIRCYRTSVKPNSDFSNANNPILSVIISFKRL